MSHAPERQEKDCLNCGTIVHGRYCHICGQENIVPKEGFWKLVVHFFYDITHFDGKFFHSLKYLFSRPGFLPSEYMKGRRASYLNPVRMYIFTSAFFFLLFFTFFYSNDEKSMVTIQSVNGKTMAEIEGMSDNEFAAFTANINREDNKPAVPMTREEFKNYCDSIAGFAGIHFTKAPYSSVKEYDSLRAAGEIHDSWITRQLIYKELRLNKKYNGNTAEMTKAFREKIIHSIPQMLFISLPLLALLLKLFYIRRKQFFYVSHAIFSIYLYIFLFAAMLGLFTLSEINHSLHWGILNIIAVFMYIGLFVYEYIAMLNFYKQGWLKTFLKFLLVNIVFLVVVGILFVIFILLSLFKI